MAEESGGVLDPAPTRPDVLAYPSPTTARYLIFAVALLASGLFIGSVIHNETLGDEWLRTVRTCESRFGGGTGLAEAISRNDRFNECAAAAQRTRVALTAGTALVLGVVAVGLLWLMPGIVIRRRRLRSLPTGLAGADRRFGELAAEARVSGRVRPLIGPAGQRDGFSFGAPGHYLVALPPAVAVRYRDPEVFDPLVRHELAHVARRDVALAWLTRTVWIALAPMLLLPVALALVSRDWSLLGGYGWRAAVLATVVALMSADLLREREHGADLRAARRQAGPEPVAGLVRRARDPEPTLRNRLLANHPTVAQRLSILDDPARLTPVGFRDGLAGGFLTALAVPLLASTAGPLFVRPGSGLGGYVLAAVLMGPMLAGAVGLGLSRAALYARAAGRDAPALGVGVGVGVGLVLGQACSLGSGAVEAGLGVARPAWLLVSGLAGCGAVLLTAGLSHLWADIAPRLKRARVAWTVALGFSSVVFATLLWSTTVFQSAVDEAGWALGKLVVPGPLSTWPVALLALLLSAVPATALTLRPERGSATPEWLVEGRGGPWPAGLVIGAREPLVTGLAAGLGGVLVLAVYRVVAGPPVGEEALDRFLGYQWLAGVVGAATVLVATVRRPSRGGGLACLAGPVAVVTVIGGFVGLNLELGASWDTDLVLLLLRPALGICFYLTLIAAVPAALASRLLPPRVRPARSWTATLMTLVTAVSVGAVVMAVHRPLVAGDLDALATRLVGDEARLSGSADPAGSLLAYEEEVAPDIEARYGDATTTAQRIWSDPDLDPATKSALTGEQVVGPLRAILADWAAYRSGFDELDDVHAVAVAALETTTERYAILAEAGGLPDQTDLARFAALGEREADLWNRWHAERLALLRAFTRPG